MKTSDKKQRESSPEQDPVADSTSERRYSGVVPKGSGALAAQVPRAPAPPAELDQPIVARRAPAPPAELDQPIVARLAPHDIVATQRRSREGGQVDPRLRFGQDNLRFPLYPYTKGPDLANDGVGYGEVLQVTVYRRVGGQLVAQTGFSRRTRSGRLVISKAEAELSSPAPASSVATNRGE